MKEQKFASGRMQYQTSPSVFVIRTRMPPSPRQNSEELLLSDKRLIFSARLWKNSS